ncbi:MAG TPA: short-chain dehydrogenase, partial [Alphaproteobacteria bacterium]|nr:short-chain dehydrogenase [Alphaproteobacteria bacterium]
REDFLILPHPVVLDYMRRKTQDYDRWLKGMRKLRENFAGTA